MSGLRGEDTAMQKIFEKKSGKQIVRGRGNRIGGPDGQQAKPLHEIRSVHYENYERESAATKTKVME